MNLDVLWDVEIVSGDKKWGLGIMNECNIEKSVKNLADRATIILPEYSMNQRIRFQDEIRRGDKIKIKLGYKDVIYETEFEGYILEIIANGGNLTITAEDELFLFRKDVKNVQFKMVKMGAIAQYLIKQINPNFKLECDYDIVYEKFTIYRATGYDVLKKLQEETGADIYFEGNTLHIHPAYIRKAGETHYSPQQNIENFSLDYKTALDKKVEVTIERVGLDGKVESYTTGQPGGEKITKKVTTVSTESIKMMAEVEYKRRMTDGYEGSFDAWLYPYVAPGYTISMTDEDYPERFGNYYVDTVKTKFSQSGIVRTVEPGIKLS